MHFKANPYLTFLALLVLVLLVNLGFWQLDRGDQKQALVDLQNERMNLAPVAVNQLAVDTTNQRYLPVQVNGYADKEKQILISNQVNEGRLGYFVLTPVILSEGDAVLVNRGWVADCIEVGCIPDVSMDYENMQLVGKIDHFPSVGMALDQADELSEGWPAVVQLVNQEKVEARLGYRIRNYQVLLDPAEKFGFERSWKHTKFKPETHYGYAFQWFALSLAWVVIYFVLTIKRNK